MSIPIITITFTDEDVRGMAESLGVEPDLAMARALDWSKAITETATALVDEQLASVIASGQA